MYNNAQAFLGIHGWESDTTSKVLAVMTDDMLNMEKAPGHSTAGEIAWHIATAPVYMLNQCGFNLDPSLWEKPEQLTVAKITEAHATINGLVREQVASKTTADLEKVYHVFGMMDWSAGMMLGMMIHHEIHHRGQLSVLLRQAGIVIPSIYGPTQEVTFEKMQQAG